MIQFIKKYTLCKLGLHKKETIVRGGYINWIYLSYSTTKCKNCDKFYTFN
jgi:hypothetical protein